MRRTLPLKAIFFLLWILLNPSRLAYADVIWTSKTAEVTANEGDEIVTAKFDLKNSSDKSLKIAEITSCCQCTSGKSNKEIYDPGEAGWIMASFAIGTRVGSHEKLLIVRTNDPKTPVTILRLKVAIQKKQSLP